jgi:hypothetical protein
VAKEYPPGTVLKARACAASLVQLHAAALAHARAQRAQRRGSAATRTRGLVRGPRARTRRKRLTRARCGFAAVAQVRMVNFMTYTDVTVEPGPRLNLILGPNGTGALTRNGPLLAVTRACARPRLRRVALRRLPSAPCRRQELAGVRAVRRPRRRHQGAPRATHLAPTPARLFRCRPFFRVPYPPCSHPPTRLAAR